MAQAEHRSLESFEQYNDPSNLYTREMSATSMSDSANHRGQTFSEQVRPSLMLPSNSRSQTDIETDHRAPSGNLTAAVVTSSTPSDLSASQNPPHMSEKEKDARAAIKEYGINLDKPKHGNYAVLALRMNSFKNWSAMIKQRPKELAEAGFFYSGQNDTVYCFYCGQGLHSWEPEDDIWEEHCKWSPTCIFVINMKGQEFIEMVKMKDTDPEGYNALKEKLEKKEKKTAVCIPRTCNDANTTSEFPKIDDLLARPSAVSVCEFYDREKTKQAIKVYMKQNGNIEFNAETLMNIIFDMEEGVISYYQLFPEETDCPQSNEENPAIDEEAELLMVENVRLRRKALCSVCTQEIVSIVFLPCGHLCSCFDCAPSLKDCIECGSFIKGTVRTFLT